MAFALLFRVCRDKRFFFFLIYILLLLYTLYNIIFVEDTHRVSLECPNQKSVRRRAGNTHKYSANIEQLTLMTIMYKVGIIRSHLATSANDSSILDVYDNINS